MSVVIDGTTGITAAAFDGAVDAADLTGTLPSSTLSTYLDPENRIINGAFDFWQRGTSSTAGGYLADRWVNGVSGGTVTSSRQSFTAGDTLGSNNPTYFLRQTVSGQSASSDLGRIYQNIEGVRSYAGQTITVLGWARRSSGSGNMAVAFDQYFGSGGSPSSTVSVAGQTVTLASSWAPFAVTVNVPSISGKTLGTSGNDNLGLSIWTSAGSNYNTQSNSLGLQTIGVDLWGIHIKQGTHTTSAVDLYRQPELGPELARCERYYQVLDINGQPVNMYPGTSQAYTASTISTMRAAPAAVFDTTFPNSGVVHFNSTSASCSFGTNVAATARSLSWRVTRTSGNFAAGEVCGHVYVRIFLDAEL